ncbi:reverse transcriptase-like protein [Planomicrobium chinense]|uniref:reverse transcriptase-like protein n=1 Tax=Planococcus chinensis TaxID=272917 RepID=UPI001CC5E8B2|nr:reverse transcriptase-like protein [Planococcus chinensis]MBZ5202698.1 reverse transcriptase-like protein [Planococcus chinensis]
MNIRIECTYRTAKGTEAFFRSEEMPAGKGMVIAEDLERTGRAKNLVFVDGYDSSWTMKEMKGYLKGVETEPHNVTVYFDGGYERETQRSGLGCAIYYEINGKPYRLRQNAVVAELLSNNEAEYAALYMAVQELEGLNVHHLPVRFIGDSKVVINQMNGEWPVIEKDLLRWADRIDEKLNSLGIQPEYELIPRKGNAEADRLATQGLNGTEISGTIELIPGK